MPNHLHLFSTILETKLLFSLPSLKSKVLIPDSPHTATCPWRAIATWYFYFYCQPKLHLMMLQICKLYTSVIATKKRLIIVLFWSWLMRALFSCLILESMWKIYVVQLSEKVHYTLICTADICNFTIFIWKWIFGSNKMPHVWIYATKLIIYLDYVFCNKVLEQLCAV